MRERAALTAAAARSGAPPGASGWRILAQDYDHLVFTYQRLLVMNWRVETTLLAVNRVSQAITEFASGFAPTRVILLTIIDGTALAPPSEVREALAQLKRTNAPFVIRSAVGYEVTGFRGAAFRGVSTGIALLSGHQFPHKIFAQLSEAIAWLASGLSSELGDSVNRDELARVVDNVRRIAPSG